MTDQTAITYEYRIERRHPDRPRATSTHWSEGTSIGTLTEQLARYRADETQGYTYEMFGRAVTRGPWAPLDLGLPTATVAVPLEILGDLLTAWSQLTAHAGPDVVPPEGDAAFDTLDDLVGELLT